MHDPAPIILFTYNRPEHTRRTLAALAANDLASSSALTVYCDAPRTEADVATTSEVREVVRGARGFRSVRVVERETNLGLARSLISGIDEALERHPTVIVMEDDLVTSPHFLRFLNDGLRRYVDDDRVVSISGYAFPVEGPMPESYFLPGTFCWGWATWRRGWEIYEHDAEDLLVRLIRHDLLYELDFRGTDPMSLILQWTANGDSRVDSWASRWMGSAALHRKLTLYPGKTLVRNIGFDGSGAHATFGLDNRRFDSPLAEAPVPLPEGRPRLRREVIGAHRRLFREWHGRGGRLARSYFRLSPFLPEFLDRILYTTLARHRLRQRATPAVREALEA